MRGKSWPRLSSEPIGNDVAVTTISTAKFGLIVAAVAAVFALYIGHVYEMQDTLDTVLLLRRENLRLHLHRNDLQREFDASIGPSVIHRRAAELGLRIAYSDPATQTPAL